MDRNKHDPIADSLGVEPLRGEVVSTPSEQSLPAPKTEGAHAANADELERDYDYARGNYYSVIEKGVEGLEEIMEIAKQSQHPRAFEVVATLMKTLADANKDLVELSKQKNAPKDDDRAAARPGPDSVTNNLFVGSTSELQQMLKDANKGNDPK